MTEVESAVSRHEEALKTAQLLIRQMADRALTLVLAESCTAGLAADLLASIPGASSVLWGSFVSYSAAAKISMLGLDQQRLERYGLVSSETVCDMAAGALAKSGADIAAAITGLAGPGGDGSAVPVGTVWIAAATRTAPPAAVVYNFTGSRSEIRFQAARAALEELLKAVEY